jgi:acyl carrier protein
MSDNDEAIIDQLRDFVIDTFPNARLRGVSPREQLLENGIIDSLGILEIIRFIETTYKIVIEDTDVIGKNFSTLSNIAQYVRRKVLSKNN